MSESSNLSPSCCYYLFCYILLQLVKYVFCSPPIKINSFQKNACFSLAEPPPYCRTWLCNFVQGRPKKEIKREGDPWKTANCERDWSDINSKGCFGESLEVQGRNLREEFYWGCFGLCHSLELTWVQYISASHTKGRKMFNQNSCNSLVFFFLFI